MTLNQIQFTDGAAYERFMGKWSQLVGEDFLAWLNPKSGLRWLDVGCGNGAFTETLVARCTPIAIAGIDPSEEQLAFARTRPALSAGQFQKGNAMELPYPDNAFDVAVMPLVIFFVPDPAKGVAEMARVVSPGGIVAAYAWDLPGKGFPYVALQEELREMGIEAPMPPSPDASRIEVLRELWSDAGLESIVTRVIRVQRTFTDFEEYWATILGGPSAGPVLAAMEAEQVVHLQSRLRLRLPADATGRITYGAWANAVSGRVP